MYGASGPDPYIITSDDETKQIVPGLPGTGNGKASSSLSPLLKWPGGKRALLPHLLPLLPPSFGRYYEPFLGGGALFFSARPYPATLSDTNEELVTCYRMIRDDPEHVLRLLGRHDNTKTKYLKVRASRPRTDSGRAARLIYLTTLAFNGIYRVNMQGEFNVPYGWKKHLEVAPRDRIVEVSAALRGRSLQCLDFEQAVLGAKAGDLVYLDPPYTVAHGNNGFLKYNAKIFSWEDQTRLARVASELSARGCHVILTNACHPSIQELYRGFSHLEVRRQSRIAASASHRGMVSELILTNLR